MKTIDRKHPLDNRIRRHVVNILREYLDDPDFGLELRESFVKKLRASLRSKKYIPFEVIKAKYL